MVPNKLSIRNYTPRTFTRSHQFTVQEEGAEVKTYEISKGAYTPDSLVKKMNKQIESDFGNDVEFKVNGGQKFSVKFHNERKITIQLEDALAYRIGFRENQAIAEDGHYKESIRTRMSCALNDNVMLVQCNICPLSVYRDMGVRLLDWLRITPENVSSGDILFVCSTYNVFFCHDLDLSTVSFSFCDSSLTPIDIGDFQILVSLLFIRI